MPAYGPVVASKPSTGPADLNIFQTSFQAGKLDKQRSSQSLLGRKVRNKGKSISRHITVRPSRSRKTCFNRVDLQGMNLLESQIFLFSYRLCIAKNLMTVFEEPCSHLGSFDRTDLVEHRTYFHQHESNRFPYFSHTVIRWENAVLAVGTG